MSSAKLLWSILEPLSRRQLVVLLILTTLSGFVELLSVGLIIPFIAIASGSLPFGRANSITKGLLDAVHSLGVSPQHTTAALGGIFLLGVVSANTYLCAYQYYAARVINLQRCNLSVRIIRELANRPLEWIDRQNSSDLLKVALTDVTYASSLTNAVTQIAGIVTRCCVVYLFFLLTQARLAVALVVSLAALYWFVLRFIQRPLILAGAAAQAAQADMFRAANELIGGARAIRSTATEGRFFTRFAQASEKAIRPQIIRTMPAYLTRAGLETATVAVVIGLLVYFNAKDGNLANGLPLLSAYAVAGIRLLPAVQQSLSYLLEIRFFTPSLQEVARLLQSQPNSQDACSTPSTARVALVQTLELRQISYGYVAEQNVLRNISLSFPKNARVAFVGETGAGKSTLIDIILALRFPQQGDMLVDGMPITLENSAAWRRSIGYVPQSVFLLDASIAENVAFGLLAHEIDSDRLRQACKIASLTDFIENLPNAYQTFVGERGVQLSGGQCQRIGIARSLYHEPDVVIFDEATSSLDTVTENSVLEALDALKGSKTLIVIAHRLNTVWDFDTIFVIDQGQLVGHGSAQELLQSCPTFSKLAQHQLNLGFRAPLDSDTACLALSELNN